MKRADRKRTRAAVARVRCPGCNRYGHLEIQTLEPLRLLCERCGWHGEPS